MKKISNKFDVFVCLPHRSKFNLTIRYLLDYTSISHCAKPVRKLTHSPRRKKLAVKLRIGWAWIYNRGCRLNSVEKKTYIYKRKHAGQISKEMLQMTVLRHLQLGLFKIRRGFVSYLTVKHSALKPPKRLNTYKRLVKNWE